MDVLIITHYDQDHVGGADTLVESLDVAQVSFLTMRETISNIWFYDSFR